MKRTNDTIEMLQYQLRRYKAMRKGAACQSLQYKLQKLMSQQAMPDELYHKEHKFIIL